jgi:hypothetical protein
MITLPALALAPAARDWLAKTTLARILNVFDRACNLVNAEGEVLSVVTSERGLTPFALMVAATEPGPFQGVMPASAVRVQVHNLSFGPVTVEWSTARIWQPAPDWRALRQYFSDHGHMHELVALAAGQGPSGSLMELFSPPGRPVSLAPAVRARAGLGAVDLVQGLAGSVPERCRQGISRLAGLGGGLTPAGDDFIVGVLLAAWAGRYGPSAEEFAMPLALAAQSRTTTLSGAYLRAAARGECTMAWHGLFEALLSGDHANAQAAIGSLLAVGHTSGADALSGFLAVEYLAVTSPDAVCNRKLAVSIGD